MTRRSLFILLLTTLLAATACDRGASRADDEPTSEATAPDEPAVSPDAPTTDTRPAPTQDVDQDKRAQLISIFGGIEQEPPKEALFRIEEDEAKLRALLISIYEDPEVATIRRQRALGLMRYLPSPATKTTYEEVLADEDTTDADRRVALRAYAAAFGVEAQPVLIELLEHPDAYTRAFAAVELGELETPEATEALEARAGVEPEEHVRWRIAKALGKDVSDAPVPPATEDDAKEEVQ